jgi:hypothetical protein
MRREQVDPRVAVELKVAHGDGESCVRAAASDRCTPQAAGGGGGGPATAQRAPLKHVVQRARHDAELRRIARALRLEASCVRGPHHRVGLAAAGLTVDEHNCVRTGQHVRHRLRRVRAAVRLLLRAARRQRAIEAEDLRRRWRGRVGARHSDGALLGQRVQRGLGLAVGREQRAHASETAEGRDVEARNRVRPVAAAYDSHFSHSSPGHRHLNQLPFSSSHGVSGHLPAGRHRVRSAAEIDF